MPGISKAFIRIEPGQIVTYGESQYRISHLLSVDSVLGVNLENNESERLRIESIRPVEVEVSTNADSEPITASKDISLYSEEEWAEAQRRFLAIKPLLEDPIRTRKDAERLAMQHHVHVSTLYLWLKQYQEAGHVSALVPAKRGRKTGTRLLTVEQEKVIESAIEQLYLSKQRHKPQDIIEEVFLQCRRAKIPAPHANTVRNRIAAISPAHALRRRGQKDIARNRYEPVLDSLRANHPLALVEVDHTEADIILVDEVHRKPIGRPWLTLAVDVYSRMIVGVYLTFEPPNAASVGMCLAQAICQKREYLAELDVSGDWSVWGLMSSVMVDNGKEFRGGVLKRACEEHGIDLQWRPALLPHFGGHIERLMGTVGREFHKLPGTTFSNPLKRRGYDSDAQSALTLRELERHLIDFIVNVYHQRVHSELGVSPRKRWEQGVFGDDLNAGTGIFPVPGDPLRIRLDFMPYFERSVQQYGVQIDNISYYDPVLDPYINAADPDNPKLKRQFLVRRDPRDISKIYFLDPADNRYTAVPYRNIGLPAMSAWELKTVQSTLKESGRRDVDEELIFEALGRMRANVEDAKQRTKTARRQATRNPKQSSPVVPRLVGPAPAASQGAQVEEDPFAAPIKPFDEVSLSR
jgi:putative transposase